MATPNYALALALSAAGWSNAETARRVNDGALRHGHRGIAIDSARVGRWIRNGEKPRPPLPDLIAGLLTETLGELYTAQSLCVAPSRSLRIALEEPDYAVLLRRAATANIAPDVYARNLILAEIDSRETGSPGNSRP